mmetsp:Transcript_20024/g.38336  ORF Transcript_20024/g.38336 Transcript_20024/m.38336 type:complete len:640 (-) Transcript_20024:439-2358(-)
MALACARGGWRVLPPKHLPRSLLAQLVRCGHRMHFRLARGPSDVLGRKRGLGRRLDLFCCLRLEALQNENVVLHQLVLGRSSQLFKHALAILVPVVLALFEGLEAGVGLHVGVDFLRGARAQQLRLLGHAEAPRRHRHAFLALAAAKHPRHVLLPQPVFVQLSQPPVARVQNLDFLDSRGGTVRHFELVPAGVHCQKHPVRRDASQLLDGKGQMALGHVLQVVHGNHQIEVRGRVRQHLLVHPSESDLALVLQLRAAHLHNVLVARQPRQTAEPQGGIHIHASNQIARRGPHHQRALHCEAGVGSNGGVDGIGEGHVAAPHALHSLTRLCRGRARLGQLVEHEDAVSGTQLLFLGHGAVLHRVHRHACGHNREPVRLEPLDPPEPGEEALGLDVLRPQHLVGVHIRQLHRDEDTHLRHAHELGEHAVQLVARDILQRVERRHQLELGVGEGERVQRRLLHNARLHQVRTSVLQREGHRLHARGLQAVLDEFAHHPARAGADVQDSSDVDALVCAVDGGLVLASVAPVHAKQLLQVELLLVATLVGSARVGVPLEPLVALAQIGLRALLRLPHHNALRVWPAGVGGDAHVRRRRHQRDEWGRVRRRARGNGRGRRGQRGWAARWVIRRHRGRGRAHGQGG